ncbi:MAG: gumI [Sphingomonas bacterium]|nr:gumI [Sphingomonas bacterium]
MTNDLRKHWTSAQHVGGREEPLPSHSGTAPAKPLQLALSPLGSAENPFVGSFTDALRGGGAEVRSHKWRLRTLIGVDVVMMHWPNEFMGRSSRRDVLPKLLTMRAARALGTRFVWVAHNLRPHDGASDFPAITRAFVRGLDGIIYLSEASRQLAHDLYDIPPRTRELVTVHGRYHDLTAPTDYPIPAPGAPVRLLNFGLIRPYKNIDRLIDVVADARSAIDLTIIGKAVDPGFARSLAARAATLPNVHLDLRPETIPQAELERAIDAAHAVVLPYREILNSGSAIQALGRHRPVLVPARGSMPELQAQIGQEWVSLYDGELTAATMDRLATELRANRRSPRPDLERFDWGPIGAELGNFLSELRPAGHREPRQVAAHRRQKVESIG